MVDNSSASMTVPGRIEARFGRQQSSRFGTVVNRNGIDIGAAAGEP